MAAALACLSSNAMAQQSDDWRKYPLGGTVSVTAEAFFPRLNTRVRLDSTSGVLGTVIDFEQNLGMSETESLPALGISWRFAKKHRLLFEYFALRRSGSAITTAEIRFGDSVFQVNLPIASFIDVDVYSFGYSYSPIFDRKKELTLSAGLNVQDIRTGLKSTGDLGIIEEDSGITAPLPAFGIGGGYAFTDKLIGRASFGLFSFDLGLSDAEQLSGAITTVNAGVEYRAFEHVGFGVRYSYFDLSVDFENAVRLTSIDYSYHGPSIAVIGRF